MDPSGKNALHLVVGVRSNSTEPSLSLGESWGSKVWTHKETIDRVRMKLKSGEG